MVSLARVKTVWSMNLTYLPLRLPPQWIVHACVVLFDGCWVVSLQDFVLQLLEDCANQQRKNVEIGGLTEC